MNQILRSVVAVVAGVAARLVGRDGDGTTTAPR